MHNKKASLNIQAKLDEQESRSDKIREEFLSKSDQELCSFADWVYNNTLSTVSEFIEAKAYYQSRESDGF